MHEEEFTGCKLAYILNGDLLVYKRDNRLDIPFPDLWDFPGGGREGDETAEQCVLRELKEEFSISLPASRLIFKRAVPNHLNNGVSFFFAAYAKQCEVDAIVFGDEGQRWELMAIDKYMAHPQAITVLKSRLQSYLDR